MKTNYASNIKDFLHAQLCYQLFITPLRIQPSKQYRDLALRGCDYLKNQRSELLHYHHPRHYVIHHLSQPNNFSAKKILITHGWMSRAGYMARLIRALHNKGFDIYAIDFPAHGEATGMQLPWTDAATILHQTINQLGPFYAVIGHSFGGSMLLNTLNLSNQYPEWKINQEPDHVILMASPTRMRTPVGRIARQLKLSTNGYLLLRKIFREQTTIDLKHLDFHRYTSSSKTPFLCIHGEDDLSITPKESILFCQHYPYASLSLIPGVDHESILIDERVEHMICDFLT
jgi:pimeloyl-ACP methyl ester carboxylesterase